MLFTLFLYRCWNIFGKLDSLEYVSFISYLLFLDSNIDLSHQALTLPTSPKAHLRPLGLGTLTALLMFEAYNTLTIQFVIPPLGDNSKILMVKTFLKSFFSPVLLTEKKKKKNHFPQLHDAFVQTRHLVFLLLPLILTILPYLHLHHIPILNIVIPSPPPSTNVPSGVPPQIQAQGINISGIQQTPLDQLTAMTMKTLNHLVPTLHLIKYSHAVIMRSQKNTTTNTGKVLVHPKKKKKKKNS